MCECGTAAAAAAAVQVKSRFSASLHGTRCRHEEKPALSLLLCLNLGDYPITLIRRCTPSSLHHQARPPLPPPLGGCRPPIGVYFSTCFLALLLARSAPIQLHTFKKHKKRKRSGWWPEGGRGAFQSTRPHCVCARRGLTRQRAKEVGSEL